MPDPPYEEPPLPGTEEDVFEEDEDIDDLDPEDSAFFKHVSERILLFSEEFCGITLFGYQREFALRIIYSIVSNDGSETTVLAARQCGKSATLGTIITGLMIILPKLANVPEYEEVLGKFKDGFMVGIFAPTEDQAYTVWSRVYENLSNPRAKKLMEDDPELEDRADKAGSKIKTVTLRNARSLCRMQTAAKKANIESKSYHYVLIDEAQDVDSEVAKRSIYPMLAFYNGSRTLTGTARRHKNVFYEAIQNNKRRWANGRCRRPDHFEYTYKTVVKYNKNYKKFIASEKARLGEDSDEFRMSYNCEWLLESGMFMTEDVLEACGDRRMDICQDWYASDVLVGIDPGKTNDSTVVTVVWVDWDHPDPYGVCEHRILNWLEIHNKRWEEQYALIYQFLRRYKIRRIGVDAQGMGSGLADRMRVLFPDIPVEELASDGKNQEDRWEYFTKLIDRGRFVYPAAGRTRKTRNYKKFVFQFSELQTTFAGKYMVAAAPDGRNNHDDYADSACIACFMSTYTEQEYAEMVPNWFYQRRMAGARR